MYYVYALIDPRSNLPFYIGKGKHKRMHNHYANFLKGKGKNECKHAVFEDLCPRQLMHIERKIFVNLTLKSACDTLNITQRRLSIILKENANAK